MTFTKKLLIVSSELNPRYHFTQLFHQLDKAFKHFFKLHFHQKIYKIDVAPFLSTYTLHRLN